MEENADVTFVGQSRQNKQRAKGSNTNSFTDVGNHDDRHQQGYFGQHTDSYQYESVHTFREREPLECKFCITHGYNGVGKHSDLSCFKLLNELSGVNLNLRKVWNNGNVMQQLCIYGSHHDAQSCVDSLRDAGDSKKGFETALSKFRHACDHINTSGTISVCGCGSYGPQAVILNNDWFKSCRECKAKKLSQRPLSRMAAKLRMEDAHWMSRVPLQKMGYHNVCDQPLMTMQYTTIH